MSQTHNVLENCKGRVVEMASIVTVGQTQTVQFPAGFRIDASEVYVKRVGRSVLLIPKDANQWEFLAESLEQVTGDFMQDRDQQTEQQREVIFE